MGGWWRFGWLGLALAIAAPGGPSHAATPKLEPFDCKAAGFEPATRFKGICGWVTVPEDHFDRRNPRTLKIAVAVVKATGAQPASDPIVYLEGGPGAAIVPATLRLPLELFPTDVQKRDIVAIDQRGVGLSQPNLDCPEVRTFALSKLDQPRSDDEYTHQYFASLKTCLDRLQQQGIHLAAYNSAQSAADVVMVSQALGYQQINVYGLSYGSRLALTIARDFDRSGYIRSVAIGGVYGPEANALEFPLNVSERLARVFEACASDSVCNAAYPDLRSVFYQLMARLATHPFKPEFELQGARRQAIADHTTLLNALFNSLLYTQGIAEIPANLYATLNGSPRYLIEGIRSQISELNQIHWGMNTAVQCQEEFLLISPAEQAAVGAQIPPIFRGFEQQFPESTPRLVEFCRQIGLKPRPASENQLVRSRIPLLAISGQFDPFTPPAWAARATAGFTTRYVYTLPEAGHDSAGASDCSQAIVSAFFNQPTRRPAAYCINPVSQPKFEIQGDRR